MAPNTRFAYGILALLLTAVSSCAVPPSEPQYLAFQDASPIVIHGYSGDAMDPFITRDSQFLFFASSVSASGNANLHWAKRVDAVTFEYLGEVPGVNTGDQEGVPSVDEFGNFYFISGRAFEQTRATIFHARGNGETGSAAQVHINLVEGLVLGGQNTLTFDAEVSADGRTLVLADGWFDPQRALPERSNLTLTERVGDQFVRLPESYTLLAEVNTAALEYGVALSVDRLELIFTRADPAKDVAPHLYRAVRSTPYAAFGDVQRLAIDGDFLESPTLSGDGLDLYYQRRVNEGFRIFHSRRVLTTAKAELVAPGWISGPDLDRKSADPAPTPTPAAPVSSDEAPLAPQPQPPRLSAPVVQGLAAR